MTLLTCFDRIGVKVMVEKVSLDIGLCLLRLESHGLIPTRSANIHTI